MTGIHRILTCTVLATLLGAPSYAADPQQAADPNVGKRPNRVVIYPILVQAPIFGASIELPRLPGGGDGEGGPVNGSTDVKLNAAYLAGVLVETNRLLFEATGTWADVSAERTVPRVRLATETLLFSGLAGVRFYKGLSVTGGFKRVSSDMDATVTPPNVDTPIEGRVSPVLWDPMLGIDWRGRHGRWDLNSSFEGGGFGVGTDVDLSGHFRADYRIGHFDLRLGYQAFYYKLTVADVQIGHYRRELVSTQTLHGPTMGFGIVF